ncbi:capsular associated protein [Mortierella polycephala]|uniref:Capsular associated protein n=1 Tax=Mortierella polycephala TaxID=41804 RepID=A0A9P6PKL8_9FUNG|nr:capsular associated protein [Mortierella polycephala]
MAIAYSPVSQQSSPTVSRRGSGDLENHGGDDTLEKPFRMSLPQRQLTGLLIFIWMMCLWITLKVMNSEAVLPDLLSRIMETIAVLGPDQCHLSIVDHGSTDSTPVMLATFREFLKSYNRGDLWPFAEEDVKLGQVMEVDDSKNQVQDQSDEKSHNRQRLSYTLTTQAATESSDSEDSKSRARNLALRPLLENTSAGGTSNKENHAGTEGKDGELLFDTVIMLEPVVACTEDILELVFQSRLQNADLTCGMDLGFTPDAMESRAVLKDAESKQGVYDSSITRDILGLELHTDPKRLKQFSTDTETQSRFRDRLPIQVQSCWSGAVVLQASSALSLLSLGHTSQDLQQPELSVEQQPSTNDQCGVQDDRARLCQGLWQQDASQPRDARIVVVPTVQLTRTPKDYTLHGLFNSWGLWPNTEKRYRDELEAKFMAMNHQSMYGYKPSTGSYGYISKTQQKETKVSVDFSTEISLDDDSNDNGVDVMAIPEPVLPLLKDRLKMIRAVFGILDIQSALQHKWDTERIGNWRQRTESAAEC